MADGLNDPLSAGHTNPSSSIVNGAGMAGSTAVGEIIMSCIKAGDDMIGAGAIIRGVIPILRRKFASMIRRASAYLSINKREKSQALCSEGNNPPFGCHLREKLHELLNLCHDGIQVQFCREKVRHLK